MKFGVWSGFYHNLQPEEAVLEFEKHGYEYTDLCFQHSVMLTERGDPAIEGRKFKAFADEHRVKYWQSHFSTQCNLCDKSGLEALKKQLDLYVAMDIKYAILHCDAMKYAPELTLEQVRERNLYALRELTDYAAGRGTLICLENLRRVVPIAMSSSDLLYFINEIGSDKLGICFDVGHLNQTNVETPEEFIKNAGKHLKTVHVNTNDGSCDQHLIPFGRGNVDMIAFTRALKKSGFDGLYDLEIPGERNCPVEVKGYKLDYIKHVMEYLDRETETL